MAAEAVIAVKKAKEKEVTTSSAIAVTEVAVAKAAKETGRKLNRAIPVKDGASKVEAISFKTY